MHLLELEPIELGTGLNSLTLEKIKAHWQSLIGNTPLEFHYIGHELFAMSDAKTVQKIADQYLTATVTDTLKNGLTMVKLDPATEFRRQKRFLALSAEWFADLDVNAHADCINDLAELSETNPELAVRLLKGIAKLLADNQAKKPTTPAPVAPTGQTLSMAEIINGRIHLATVVDEWSKLAGGDINIDRTWNKTLHITGSQKMMQTLADHFVTAVAVPLYEDTKTSPWYIKLDLVAEGSYQK